MSIRVERGAEERAHSRVTASPLLPCLCFMPLRRAAAAHPSPKGQTTALALADQGASRSSPS